MKLQQLFLLYIVGLLLMAGMADRHCDRLIGK
jgi:hypothetical protein